MNNNIIIIFIILIINNIAIIKSQSDISWIGDSATCNGTYVDSGCWSSEPISGDNLILNSSNADIDEVYIGGLPGKTVTYGNILVGGSFSVRVEDTKLIVSDIILGETSSLSVEITDSYYATISKRPATVSSMVLLNLSNPNIQLLYANSITLNDQSFMNIYRSENVVKGSLFINNNATLNIQSAEYNSEPYLEVASSTLTGTSKINLQGPSLILLNNTVGGTTLQDSSSIIAKNASQVQITGELNLSGTNILSLQNSNLFLDSLVMSSTSTLDIQDSTLSLISNSDITFSPKSATFKNSVFTYKANNNFNSPITIDNSIFNFYYTTTLNSQFNGNNVQFYLESAEFNLGNTGKFSCSNCNYALRNSIMNFDSFSNNGEFKLYGSTLNTNSDVISSNGIVYGYNGNFSKGVQINNGTLGSMEERTRLFIDGNVVLKDESSIKLYLNSPMDYSWLNISGSLNTPLVEVYIYIEILDNSTMTIIKADKGFINPLDSDNVVLYIYDPDNNVANQTNSCKYLLQFTDTSVIITTDFSCEDVVISSGKNGLSKGALAGISIGMIALASGISFLVWWKTRKSSNSNNSPSNYTKKELNTKSESNTNSMV